MDGEPHKNTFYLEEYKALRGEVLLLKQHQYAIQKWVVVSVGIIYGLAFSTQPEIHGVSTQQQIPYSVLPAVNRVILFLGAFAISGIGATFYAVNDYTLLRISNYLQEIEYVLTQAGWPKGWEHLQRAKRPIWGVLRSPFWGAVLGLTGLLAGLALFSPSTLRAFFVLTARKAELLH